MTQQNASSGQNGQSAPKKEANPVVVWGIILAIAVGFWWIHSRRQERDAQRRREIIREAHVVISDDDVKLYRASGRDMKQRLKEIDSRYDRPIWENVPEDKSGKGVIIIKH